MPQPNEVRGASGAPGAGYWQQRADYAIEATLDAEARVIAGRETITYSNNSPDELTYLWLNLEQNLFNPSSEGARLTVPGGRFGNRNNFEGGYKILSVRVDGEQQELAIHGTVARLDLPVRLPARGGVVAIEIAWTFKIPPYGSDRMGIFDAKDGAIFQIAQWFPSVCVYDDVHGWNTLPYLGHGEFYTNFGSYDVKLTVPAGHVVAATGELVNEDEVLSAVQRERLSAARATKETVVIQSGDEVSSPPSQPPGSAGRPDKTWRFKVESARTFAWASSAAFVWDAAFQPGCGPGAGAEMGGGRGTLCQSLYPREAAAVWGPEAMGGGSTQMLRTSVEHYSEKWYPYPLASASNINGIVGGMEYPGIIFCGGGRRGDDAPDLKDAERGLFGVTTHEIGHNWFPMLVSTDERRHAWMDEGFNTFINYYASLERSPNDLPRRGNPRVWARDNKRPPLQPIDLPADQLVPGTLGDQQYAKTSVGLVLLREGVLGPERFDRAFKEYVRRWAFKSPRPWDFFRTMEDAAGMDLSWFWRGWFYSTGVLDQAVTTVMQPPKTGEGADGRNARATFVNRGELVMPLTFKVSYTDGSEEVRVLPVEAWFTTNQWQTTWDAKGREIRRVEVDPGQDMPDVELGNNVWER